MGQKNRGVLAYLLGIIGGAIVLFGFKDNDSRTKFNACQAITIGIASIVISIAIRFIPYGEYVGNVFSILFFVLNIIGAVKSYKEEDVEFPVISDLTRKMFKKQLD